MSYTDAKKVVYLQSIYKELESLVKEIGTVEGTSTTWNSITGDQTSVNLSGFTNDAGFITGAGTLAAVATTGSYSDLSNTPILGTASASDIEDFATALQGTLAESALQSVNWGDIQGSITNQTDLNSELDAKQSISEKGMAGGYASLDQSGLVPLDQLNISGLGFFGSWDASTNTPTLIDGTGNVGDFGKVSVAGTYDFGNGAYTFNVGDWVMFAGGTWQRIGVHESVSSVNNKIGAVVINKSDIGLSNVDNTSDINKPISTSQQLEFDTKVNKSGDTMTGNLSMSNNKITNLVNGTNPNDAVNLSQLQTFTNVQGTIKQPIPAVLAYINTNQPVPDTSPHVVAWNGVVYDQFNMHNGSTGFVVPSWAGYAKVTAKIEMGNSSSGTYRSSRTALNGNVTPIGLGYSIISPHTGNVRTLISYTSGIFPVQSGDVITNIVNQNSGGPLSLLAGSNNDRCFIQIELYETV